MSELTPTSLTVILAAFAIVNQVLGLLREKITKNGNGKAVVCPGSCKLEGVDHDLLMRIDTDLKSMRPEIKGVKEGLDKYTGQVLGAPLERFVCRGDEAADRAVRDLKDEIRDLLKEHRMHLEAE